MSKSIVRQDWLRLGLRRTVVVVVGWYLSAGLAFGLTANQVSFEFRPNGIYRVYLFYTIPALKELRESYVEFTTRKEAEKFYFDVLRGADFYLDDPKDVRFVNQPLEAQPW
jgi:hypothetical protein